MLHIQYIQQTRSCSETKAQFLLDQMLSPLGGSGSGVDNWKVKQTGTPVRAVLKGIGKVVAVEKGAVGLMICGGKGGVAPLGNSWYVLAICGAFVPQVPMFPSVSVRPECSVTSVSGRTCTVSGS